MIRSAVYCLILLAILALAQLAHSQAPIIEGQACGGDQQGTYPNCSQAASTLAPQAMNTAVGGEPQLGLCAAVDSTDVNLWFFIPCGGAGGSTPGGPVASVQFHDTGTILNGQSDFSYDKGNQRLTVGTGGIDTAASATTGGAMLLKEISTGGTNTWGFDLGTDNLAANVNCYVAGGRIFGECQQYAATGRTQGITIENLTSAHDNIMFHVAADAETVVAVGCQCQGACSPTLATIALQTHTGTTMVHPTPTCVANNAGPIIYQAVTSSGELAPGVGVMMNVTNTPTVGDTYSISIRYQRQ